MGLFEEAKKISKVVIDKGIEVGKAAKTQINIATMESKINDCKKRIGDIVFKEKIETKNGEIENEIKKIESLIWDIKNKQNGKE